MASVHILIQAESGQMWAVSESLEKIEHVEKVHVVTGPYDIIVHLNMPVEDLRGVMDDVHTIPGIIRTETCIAVRT
ncbi:MAG: Lrp/AsnC ligand binding domain-containing protein [Candidatus Thorarchaeota archaeon]|jgi:DNA-binding Lrp family transcriptional regulator